jgi:uncharacterized membrane protein
MKKFSLLDASAIVIWLVPIGYLCYIYPSLPATVPMHFDVAGKPNGFGTRSSFLTFQYIMLGLSPFLYLLLKYIPAIDPKKKVKVGESAFVKLGLGLVVLFSALDIMIVYATKTGGFRIDRILLPMIGLFFAFIGNLMHNIKPNYFAGIRTPWTLEDNDTWRVTHRLAGKLWFAGGIVITITMLFLPLVAGLITFFSITLVLVAVPIIYSYNYYKKHHPNKSAE